MEPLQETSFTISFKISIVLHYDISLHRKKIKDRKQGIAVIISNIQHV